MLNKYNAFRDRWPILHQLIKSTFNVLALTLLMLLGSLGAAVCATTTLVGLILLRALMAFITRGAKDGKPESIALSALANADLVGPLNGRQFVIGHKGVSKVLGASRQKNNVVHVVLDDSTFALPRRQVQAILLHELHHSDLNARWRKLFLVLFFSTGAAETFLCLAGLTFVPALIAAFAVTALFLFGHAVSMRLAREEEYACDKFAQDHGTDAIGALEEMQRRQPDTHVALPFGLDDLFASHPRLSRRLRALREAGGTKAETTRTKVQVFWDMLDTTPPGNVRVPLVTLLDSIKA